MFTKAANFSNINEYSGLHVSNFQHKVCLNFNEGETKATDTGN